MSLNTRESTLSNMNAILEKQNSLIKMLEAQVQENLRKQYEEDELRRVSAVRQQVLSERVEILERNNEAIKTRLGNIRKDDRIKSQTSKKVFIAISGLILIVLLTTGVTMGVLYFR